MCSRHCLTLPEDRGPRRRAAAEHVEALQLDSLGDKRVHGWCVHFGRFYGPVPANLLAQLLCMVRGVRVVHIIYMVNISSSSQEGAR